MNEDEKGCKHRQIPLVPTTLWPIPGTSNILVGDESRGEPAASPAKGWNMLTTRREWLLTAGCGASVALAASRRVAAAQHVTARGLEDRIARIIGDYARQGFHRTGTAVDPSSGDWLCRQVQDAGCRPSREPFSF